MTNSEFDRHLSRQTPDDKGRSSYLQAKVESPSYEERQERWYEYMGPAHVFDCEEAEGGSTISPKKVCNY